MPSNADDADDEDEDEDNDEDEDEDDDDGVEDKSMYRREHVGPYSAATAILCELAKSRYTWTRHKRHSVWTFIERKMH